MNNFVLEQTTMKVAYVEEEDESIAGNTAAAAAKDVTHLSRFLISFVDGKNMLSWSIATLFRIYLLAYHVDLVAGVFKLRDFTSRFLAIKELNLIWFTFAVMKSAPEVTSLCDTIDRLNKAITNNHPVISPVAKAKKRELIKKRDEKLRQSGEFYAKILPGAFILTAFLPFCQVVFCFFYLTFSAETDWDLDDLPFVMFSYYPDSYKTLNTYILVQFSTCFLLYMTVIHYLLPIFTSISQTTISIVYEIELMCLRLKHLNDLRSGKDNGEVLLKFHASALVKSHVYLANDIKSLNKGINGLSVGYMNVMALQICMYLFCLLEFEDIVIRLKYAFCIIFVIMVMSVCTSFGQKIINAGDNLSGELYNCPWLDMPNWFKRSLLLMMTRSIRTMELKPYGLYVLDLRCLTNIVNATYSYFNFFLKV